MSHIDADQVSQTDIALTGLIDDALPPGERATLEARLKTDPALRARFEQLAAAGPSVDAYDLLLDDAPMARLTAALDAAGARPANDRGWGRIAAAAAAILLVVVGTGVGFGVARFAFPELQVVHGPPANWRAAVADYWGLYTDETLAAIPDDPERREQELAEVVARMSIDLTVDDVALPDMQLKRAQVLEFKGLPLAQIAFLSEDAGPVAFCIIANDKPDIPLTIEEREGWPIAFWNQGGIGYLLIGKLPEPTLKTLAEDLEARVS
ncbi:MAG: hypothetical protein GY798_03760 [Hyphomicrobiales bacterium]|nr:hypothetical protein [Hyphomicrobiales bacterium]